MLSKEQRIWTVVLSRSTHYPHSLSNPTPVEYCNSHLKIVTETAHICIDMQIHIKLGAQKVAQKLGPQGCGLSRLTRGLLRTAFLNRSRKKEKKQTRSNLTPVPICNRYQLLLFYIDTNCRNLTR